MILPWLSSSEFHSATSSLSKTSVLFSIFPHFFHFFSFFFLFLSNLISSHAIVDALSINFHQHLPLIFFLLASFLFSCLVSLIHYLNDITHFYFYFCLSVFRHRQEESWQRREWFISQTETMTKRCKTLQNEPFPRVKMYIFSLYNISFPFFLSFYPFEEILTHSCHFRVFILTVRIYCIILLSLIPFSFFFSPLLDFVFL